MTVRILVGDCLLRMRELADSSVDSVVCDPPYHLASISKRWTKSPRTESTMPTSGPHRRVSRGFMGQTWDGGDVAFQAETWAEVLRVLKPGGFLLAFGGDRTFHRLAVAIEDAGFDYRGTVAWLFGSGFPKSLNVSRALADIPACSCAEVPSHCGSVVSAGGPLGLSGAGVGTESCPVDLTGLPAGADGLGLQPSAEALRRKPAVESGIEAAVGHLDPVVLGSLDVAGIAEGEQVAGDVGAGEVKPEALRDKMVDDQLLGCPTVGAPAVAGDNLRAESLPLDPLVSPLLAPPGGVVRADEAGSIMGGHAGSGAVSARPPAPEIVGSEVSGAGLADEHGHNENPTAKRTGLQCEVCGGVIAENVPEGLGTALKPALELIAMARKPLSESTIAANVLKWGTGALNIDGCRISTEGEEFTAPQSDPAKRQGVVGEAWQATGGKDKNNAAQRASIERTAQLGRWPANLCHDGSDEVVAGFPATEPSQQRTGKRTGILGEFAGQDEIVMGHDDEGGSAARFFYCAKATTEERGEGNNHPTVKPVALMQWLVRLVTPKGGTVLDPFMGSGSTAIACDAEQFNFIGCELSGDYAAIAEQRIRKAAGLFAAVEIVPPIEAAA